MNKHPDSKAIKFFIADWLTLKKNPMIMVIIVLMLPVIYGIVYSTGGIKFVYSHTMYIPIILAGIFYGASFGATIGLAAAILLGPLMPIDTITGELQDPVNWIYRLFIFVMVGSIIGYASTKLRRDAIKIETMMSINQETGIPNTNALKRFHQKHITPNCTAFTILINNHHSIIDVLGTDVYHTLIHQIYIDLSNGLNKQSLVVQSDANRLWVLMPIESLEAGKDIIIESLNQSKIINDIPLYIDYSIGAAMIYGVSQTISPKVFIESDSSARYAQRHNLVYVLGDKTSYQKRVEYDLLASFAKAINNQETFLVYQPKINMKTGRIHGIEALIRWNHPGQGLISPSVFIPLIEETKLIHTLTDWVLKHALLQCRKMIDAGHRVPVAINVSAKNLFDPLFFDRSIKIIKDSGVPYELIKFELTESTLMANPEDSKAILAKFVKLGIKIAIDDFGSGYSSLAYLTQFPIHFIKIDRLFMQDVMTNPAMLTIVKSTIDLSKNLGYGVVVEGIETKEVSDLIASYDCDFAQGYYYAYPMTSEKLNEWLTKPHH